MKKLFLLLSIFLISHQAYGFEDYVVISDNPVSSIVWSDDSVLEASPLLTIDNRKDTIIVKIKKEGQATLTIETSVGRRNIEVDVTPEKTVLSEVEGFSYFVLDKSEGKWSK